VYLGAQKRLLTWVRKVIKDKYDVELGPIAIEQPPDLKMGEFALPVAFELARKLRRAPKIIATELAEALNTAQNEISRGRVIHRFEAAGAGYLNAYANRGGWAETLAELETASEHKSGLHVLVEHTSINPNKAAHIGHLRNAILGDTFVRILRANGQKVDVQNYIDNTGVQVADVVVGFVHLESKSLAQVRQIIANSSVDPQQRSQRFDYLCWDIYARVSQWYDAGSEDENKQRKALRYAILHAIEAGNNETAEIAELISTAVLRMHLETMLRLDIEYDFLPRESEILHLKFWDLAFAQLKQTGVLYFETEGKNKGCWVMTRPDAKAVEEGATDEDAKVIVRSNGTVTYVGKDIAYHLWKFGLLGRDFAYRPFFAYDNHICWISTVDGVEPHPHFGGAQAIYNVIDSRQSDPQANVIQALRGMGHTAEADRYTHFSYEMVALTPRCAVDLGYTVSDEDLARPYIEVSGRKGFGVKADDLIDKLIAATRKETDQRQPERPEAERQIIAEQIALGALRYFMLKFTRGTVIAFDFKDALSFEGETGPYVQYAIVRIRNIFRKAETTPEQVLSDFAALDAGSLLQEADEIWAIWLRVSKRSLTLEQCIATSEPAYIARHAFQLAQEFNNFYHRHHILTEEDPARKTLLLATAAIAQRELITVLNWLGIEAPEVM
jgi:arginyl-tRNA synthetase